MSQPVGGSLKRKRSISDDIRGNESSRPRETEPQPVSTLEGNTKAYSGMMNNGNSQLILDDLAGHETYDDTSPDLSRKIPVQVWQHVFSFCHPLSLAQLLRVNSRFGHALDSDSNAVGTRLDTQTGAEILPGNLVWSRSRRNTLPTCPRPLRGKSERDMLMLIFGRRCHFCDQSVQTQIIWTFAIRSCRSCLPSYAIKEEDLLDDSRLRPIIAGLSYAYMTNDLDYVNTMIVKSGCSPESPLTKWYLRSDALALASTGDQVQDLGIAAVEEWYKGLAGPGTERMSDAARFERYEISGGLTRLLSSFYESVRESKTMGSIVDGHFRTNIQPTRMPDIVEQAHLMGVTPLSLGHLPYLPLQTIEPAPGQAHLSPSKTKISSTGNRFTSLKPTSERSSAGVKELKAKRKAEIERRCQLLDPPIMPSTLAYMDVFKAALQIPMLLDDNAWEMLKPRLLGEREQAGIREDFAGHGRAAGTDPGAITHPSDPLDGEVDPLQNPVKASLSLIVDDYIRSQWRGGHDTVTFANAPQFAASVLTHALQSYSKQRIPAVSTPSAVSSITKLVEGSWPRIKLEDIKWICDFKLRPITSKVRKELYLCSSCEGKFYAFDPLIQHYAAKHTAKLSYGNAILYWKAEWPDELPFNPHPELRKTTEAAAITIPAAQRYQSSALPRSLPPAGIQFPHTSGTSNITSPVWLPPVWTGGTTQPPVKVQGPAVPDAQPNQNSPQRPGGANAQSEYDSGLARQSRQWLNPQSTLNNPLQHAEPLSVFDAGARTNAIDQSPPSEQELRILIDSLRDNWIDLSALHIRSQSVQIQSLVHLVCQDYSGHFGRDLRLDYFVEALRNTASLQRLFGSIDLMCKVCMSRYVQDHQHRLERYRFPADEEPYDLLGLLLHVSAKHVTGTHVDRGQYPTFGQQGMDWKYDLVYISSTEFVPADSGNSWGNGPNTAQSRQLVPRYLWSSPRSVTGRFRQEHESRPVYPNEPVRSMIDRYSPERTFNLAPNEAGTQFFTSKAPAVNGETQLLRQAVYPLSDEGEMRASDYRPTSTGQKATSVQGGPLHPRAYSPNSETEKFLENFEIPEQSVTAIDDAVNYPPAYNGDSRPEAQRPETRASPTPQDGGYYAPADHQSYPNPPILPHADFDARQYAEPYHHRAYRETEPGTPVRSYDPRENGPSQRRRAALNDVAYSQFPARTVNHSAEQRYLDRHQLDLAIERRPDTTTYWTQIPNSPQGYDLYEDLPKSRPVPGYDPQTARPITRPYYMADNERQTEQIRHPHAAQPRYYGQDPYDGQSAQIHERPAVPYHYGERHYDDTWDRENDHR